MTNKIKLLRQSLERGAQCVRPLELLLQAKTLSEQDKKVLAGALSTVSVQSEAVGQQLSELLQRFGEQQSSAKQQLWERKLLDLSLRNSLLNYHVGRNAYIVPNQTAAQLEDVLEAGQEIGVE